MVFHEAGQLASHPRLRLRVAANTGYRTAGNARHLGNLVRQLVIYVWFPCTPAYTGLTLRMPVRFAPEFVPKSSQNALPQVARKVTSALGAWGFNRENAKRSLWEEDGVLRHKKRARSIREFVSGATPNRARRRFVDYDPPPECVGAAPASDLSSSWA